jgi:hypothetical protein
MTLVYKYLVNKQDKKSINRNGILGSEPSGLDAWSSTGVT